MPIYPYRCLSGHLFELANSARDYISTPCCPECGHTSKRIYTAPLFSIDYYDQADYSGVLSRTRFSNKKEFKTYLKQKGLEESGPENFAAAKKRHEELKEKKADTVSVD